MILRRPDRLRGKCSSKVHLKRSRKRLNHTREPLFVFVPTRLHEGQTNLEVQQAYFELENGGRVTNVLSYGPNDELLLTFSFANGVPGFADTAGVDRKVLNERVGTASVQCKFFMLGTPMLSSQR
jgi:hypothetical protein